MSTIPISLMEEELGELKSALPYSLLYWYLTP
jgi:hypothetical protein